MLKSPAPEDSVFKFKSPEIEEIFENLTDITVALKDQRNGVWKETSDAIDELLEKHRKSQPADKQYDIYSEFRASDIENLNKLKTTLENLKSNNLIWHTYIAKTIPQVLQWFKKQSGLSTNKL